MRLFHLPAIAACLLLVVAAAACDHRSEQQKGAGASGRSEAVLATSGTFAAPSPSAPIAREAPPPTKKGKLCEAQLSQPPRPLPGKTLFVPVAANTPPRNVAGDKLTSGAGRWLWIDFFAGWCAPCKEEMPRIRAFEARLQQAGTPVQLAFVSLDDDARELNAFLDAQPPSGVRSALWLKEGSTRSEFLNALRLKDPPTLPAQAFVDPEGQVRCAIEGAVEESDYAALLAMVARK